MGLEGKEAKGNGKQSRKDNECKSTSDWRSGEINPFQLLKKLVYSRMHCVILVVGCVSLGCEILGERSRLLQGRSNEQKPLTDTASSPWTIVSKISDFDHIWYLRCYSRERAAKEIARIRSSFFFFIRYL